MQHSHSGPAVSGVVVTTPTVLRLAAAAYLARFKGQSRIHTESDLRGYLIWCEARGLEPLAATRPHVELYVRWLQEVHRQRLGLSAHVERIVHLEMPVVVVLQSEL
jgi:integrase/recombinase XerD